MAVKAGTGYIDIRGDFSKLNRELSGRRFAAGFAKVGALAGGAIAAGIAVEAKRAVDAFYESNKVAKQTQAVLKSTGGAANVTAKGVSNLATAISRKTGVDDEAIASGENLLLTFTKVRNEVGKGNDIFTQSTKIVTDMSVALGQDMKSSAIQVGKALNDPIKGVTALQRVGVSFTADQKEQIKTLVESGKALDAQRLILRELRTEFGGSAKAQATSLDKLRVAAGNLEEDLGSGLAPAVDAVANKLTSFAIDVEPQVIRATDRIAKAFGRKDLSLDQKFRLSYQEARKVFEPLIDEARVAVDEMHLDDKLSEAVEFAAPKIADAAAASAPRVASAFVNSFIDAGPWGKLAIGGWLLAKMGGLGAFTKLGRRAGGAMAAGAATSSAAGGAAGAAASAAGGATLGSKLLAGARTAGLVAGVATLPLLFKETEKASKPAQEALKNFDAALDQNQSIVAASRRVETLIGWIRKLGKEKGATKWGQEMGDELQKLNNPLQGVIHQIDRMSKSGSGDFKTLAANVRLNTRAIKRTVGENTDASRELMARNFNAAAESVKRAMEAGTISTRRGTRLMNQYLRDALAQYGIKGDQATRYLNNQDTATGKSLSGAAGAGKQRGGPITVGKPSGDSVPAMLERGEYVLNREAVKHIGPQVLDRINFGAAPRFQSGGIVALGRELQREGYAVGEHPAFGGVHAVHAPNSYHYRGMALDVNADGWPGGEPAALDKLYARLKRMPGIVELLWRVKGHFDHLHAAMSGAGGMLGPVDVPTLKRVLMQSGLGAVTALGQAGLDRVRGAAQQRLQSIASSVGIEGAEPNAAAGKYGKAALKKLWTQAGGDPSQANLMAAIALAESGGDAGIVNSIGATGLWQIHPGGSQYLDPLTNARTAVSKLRSQGLGAWEAYTNGSYRQFVQRGGLVGFQGGGGVGFQASPLWRNAQLARRLQKPGSLGHALSGALRKVRTGKSPKLRRGAVDKLLGRIRGLDLPAKLADQLKGTSGDAAKFADYADRAATLSTTDADGNTIAGSFQGKTQAQWLQDQLGALFAWRNALIRAQEAIRERREKIIAAIKQARERLAAVAKQIGRAAGVRKGLAKQLATARKHPTANRPLIKRLTEQIKGIDGDQKVRTRLRDALTQRILPALTGQRSDLTTARGDVLSNLTDVQGLGSSMQVMKTLPPMGTLGGSILNVQAQIRDLTAQAPGKVTDPTSDSGSDERVGLIEQLLREANLRTAVSERQFEVFRNFPPFGGSFKDGGIVPGPVGAPRMILAHGGETVNPVGGDGSRVRVVVEDHRTRVFVDDIEQVVERVTRRQARAGARALPGRGGGLTR